MRKADRGKPTKKKELTEKESRLVQAFLAGAKTKAEAAIEAGYSSKYPSSSANQALESIKLKSPDIMDKLGLSIESLIKNHLTPLLHAQETKLFVYDGETIGRGKKKRVTKRVLRIHQADNTTRRFATRMAFELQGAFPPDDPALAAQVGVSVVVIDVPRPDRSAINVTPPLKRSIPPPARSSGNGAKGNGAKPVVDPRPEQ